jgi:RNA polymerase sigma-B factor
MSLEQVREAREASVARAALSLDAPRRGEEEGDGVGYFLGAVEEPSEVVEDELQPVLRALPERERTILALRFEQELTQTEIAERLGISQMHVSRLLHRSLARIRPVAEAARRAAA